MPSAMISKKIMNHEQLSTCIIFKTAYITNEIPITLTFRLKYLAVKLIHLW